MVKKCALSIAMALLLTSAGLANVGQVQGQVVFAPQMAFGPGFVGSQTNCYMGTMIQSQLVGQCFGPFPFHHYVGNWFGFAPWLPIGGPCRPWLPIGCPYLPPSGPGCHFPPVHCGIGSVAQFQCQVINSCGGSVFAAQNQVCTIGP